MFPNGLTWNEMKEKIGLFRKYKCSCAVLKQEQWNTETFKLFQSKYMNQFGKLYKIDYLVNFQLVQESDVIIVDNSNEISKNDKFSDINLAADEINNCIRKNLNSFTEYRIRYSLNSIKLFKKNFISKDEMLALLIRIRTRH